MKTLTCEHCKLSFKPTEKELDLLKHMAYLEKFKLNNKICPRCGLQFLKPE